MSSRSSQNFIDSTGQKWQWNEERMRFEKCKTDNILNGKI